mmetsp:Transcript_18518/g.42350  ORF Transcript_18518/g.42350 Transcript_18518/m.42350 type:complete len:403 (+) Transcript_18518:1306-2514(+)
MTNLELKDSNNPTSLAQHKMPSSTTLHDLSKEQNSGGQHSTKKAENGDNLHHHFRKPKSSEKENFSVKLNNDSKNESPSADSINSESSNQSLSSSSPLPSFNNDSIKKDDSNHLVLTSHQVSSSSLAPSFHNNENTNNEDRHHHVTTPHQIPSINQSQESHYHTSTSSCDVVQTTSVAAAADEISTDILNELNNQLDSMNINLGSPDDLSNSDIRSSGGIDLPDDVLNELSQSLDDSGVNAEIVKKYIDPPCNNIQKHVNQGKTVQIKKHTEEWYKPNSNKNSRCSSPVSDILEAIHPASQPFPKDPVRQPPQTRPTPQPTQPEQSFIMARRNARRERALSNVRRQRAAAASSGNAASKQMKEKPSTESNNAAAAARSTASASSRPYIPGRSRREALRRMRG